jgi:hypothetical protein
MATLQRPAAILARRYGPGRIDRWPARSASRLGAHPFPLQAGSLPQFGKTTNIAYYYGMEAEAAIRDFDLNVPAMTARLKKGPADAS